MARKKNEEKGEKREGSVEKKDCPTCIRPQNANIKWRAPMLTGPMLERRASYLKKMRVCGVNGVCGCWASLLRVCCLKRKKRILFFF